MKKRRLLAVAVAVCLIAILACGSLAYFTNHTNGVTNKFYVATYNPENPDVPINPDTLFSITIYETQADGSTTTEGLTYNNILPGSELDKDPTIKNTGEYSAYVRMQVTFDHLTAWNTAGVTDLTTLLTGINTTDWTLKATETVTDSENDTVTYVFYRANPLAKDATSTLFTGVKVPTSLTIDQMIALGNFNITISGDAIQSDNIPAPEGKEAADVYDAFALFETPATPNP